MSKHTISRADQYIAGDGYAPKGNEFGIRGLEVDLPLVENIGVPGGGDLDYCATSQIPAAAGLLTLDGVGATDGKVTMNVTRNVTITTTADETDRTFTVTGTDANGARMLEELVGVDTGTGQGAKAFLTIESIAIDGPAASLEVGRGTLLGLKARSSRGLFHVAVEDGAVAAGTFVAGSGAAQGASGADGRASYVPASSAADLQVMYIPDRSAQGIKRNYTG